MRRRSLLVRAAAAVGAAFPLASQAETPAERASRALNAEIARDRAVDAAVDARGADTARSSPQPQITRSAQDLDADRASIRPDVGRPEEVGRSPESLRTTGEDRNVNR